MADTDQLKTMISGLAGKTVYGQLEPLMPEIDRKIREGVPRAEIHQLITAQGIEISQGTFYNYLHRYRKRNSTTASPATKATQAKPSNKIAPPPVVQNGNSEAAVDEPETESSKMQHVEPSPADLLSNEQSREEFANQFMTRPSIRRGKKQ